MVVREMKPLEFIGLLIAFVTVGTAIAAVAFVGGALLGITW